MVNQNPYIEEGQTTQLQKEKVQKDKQRSTKHTRKYEAYAMLRNVWLVYSHMGSNVTQILFDNAPYLLSLTICTTK